MQKGPEVIEIMNLLCKQLELNSDPWVETQIIKWADKCHKL